MDEEDVRSVTSDGEEEEVRLAVGDGMDEEDVSSTSLYGMDADVKT